MANPGPRSPQLIPSTGSSPSVSHRQSFADNLRGMPASPRASRQPSLSQQALQDLLNNPPVGKNNQNSAFAGRDWRSVKVGEIIDPELVRFVEIDTSVEEATNVLISSGSPNVVLLRENKESHAAIGTFDYSDLNAYLLLVVGLARPEASEIQSFNELAEKGREGKPIPLKDVKDLGKKEPLITLPHSASLTKAVEIFGSGIHRIIIVKEHSSDVIGILTQLRLTGFFWQNGRSFPSIDQLYPSTLRELNLGSQAVIAINGDKPVTDALELMHNEGITSLPVLDNQNNVIGNISHVDVRDVDYYASVPRFVWTSHTSCDPRSTSVLPDLFDDPFPSAKRQFQPSPHY
ncbi:cell separation during budding [Neofusicoccum ribis]|uniref:Cell separation during budding n=1 Tax=Neofusicoccum ribis TaxID=45134 RepID=A0ABR3SEM8_9PEZI